ncbi:MAG: hypothetical protein JNL32_15660 [Candidatus Kapabacteria bacterium]|nr:hypothetical protein [Candidatus Kapabacteria bacterium]
MKTLLIVLAILVSTASLYAQRNGNAYHYQQVDNGNHIQSSRSGTTIGAAFCF